MIWEWAIKDKINQIFIYLEQKITLQLIAKNVKTKHLSLFLHLELIFSVVNIKTHQSNRKIGTPGMLSYRTCLSIEISTY